jgi:hypothetical protein
MLQKLGTMLKGSENQFFQCTGASWSPEGFSALVFASTTYENGAAAAFRLAILDQLLESHLQIILKTSYLGVSLGGMPKNDL